MKSFTLILLGFLLMAATGRKDLNTTNTRWVVERSSRLDIEGSSNINSFRCEVEEYLKRDTLSFVADEKSGTLRFNNSSINIDVNRFDCHQKYITSDLRKTLKSDENPQLQIHFLVLDNFDPAADDYRVNCLVDIILAGSSKRAVISFVVDRISNQQIELSGNKTFRFSDFGLKPPRKLAGLIRINEEIKVNFQLMLKTI